MSTTELTTPPAPPEWDGSAGLPEGAPPPVPPPVRGPAWQRSDRIGLAVCWGLGVLFCAMAVAIVGYMCVEGLKYMSPSLLVTSPKVGFTEAQTGGFSDAIIGTLAVSVMGMAIAMPVGVGIAIWLSEFGRPFALARVAESTIEMIAGTPTIVLALFGTVIFTSPALGFLSRSAEGIVFGRSFFAAAAMLSLVALPLVVGSVREGLQAIPRHIREASYAVGKTKSATTRRILLPAVRPSVATGAMLGVGRIIGDTAIIVALLGATLNSEPANNVPLLGFLRGTGSTLTSYVFQNAPTGERNNPEKAYAAAFVLLVIVLLLNVAVDMVHRRARKVGTWTS
jgi:phosphate transport system permease protein